MLTIKELREELDRLEFLWDMDEYMGAFEDQTVMGDCYHNEKYEGIGPARIVPYWELGLCIFQEGKLSEKNEG